MIDDKPPEKPTVKLEAMTDRKLLEDLTRVVKEGFASQADQLIQVNQRLVRVELRQDSVEDRLNANSMRARAPSEHDVETKMALQHETMAREALAKDVAEIKFETSAQTAMLTTLTYSASKVLANPMVRSIAVMLGTALLTWLASHGVKPLP